MTPEQTQHFNSTGYKRYPFEGKFMVHGESGPPHSVTLWLTDEPIEDLNKLPQRRFFEKDGIFSPIHVRIVPQQNIMDRTDYNSLLSGLLVPTVGTPEEYETEQTLYVANLGHRVIVERTHLTLPEHQQHTRIRRQAIARTEEEQTVRNYRELVGQLDRSGVIFKEDFSHWRSSAVQFGAEGEIATRLNRPRR